MGRMVGHVSRYIGMEQDAVRADVRGSTEILSVRWVEL